MKLLPLNDLRWRRYHGGYKLAVRELVPFLTKLQLREVAGDDWNILWDDLHHQGDVGEASYAVVPYLAEYAKSASPIAWHAFGFPAVVELSRTEQNNPEVPDEIRESYHSAIGELAQIALDRGQGSWDELCFEPVMACLALALGRREHARAYLELSESELPGFFKHLFGEEAE